MKPESAGLDSIFFGFDLGKRAGREAHEFFHHAKNAAGADPCSEATEMEARLVQDLFRAKRGLESRFDFNEIAAAARCN